MRRCGGNFAKTMLRLAQECEQVKVNDQCGAPTGAELIADVTAHAIRRALQPVADDDELSGIYNLVASGSTTWFAYAQYVIAQSQRLQPGMKIKATEVNPVPNSAFPAPAQRPRNSRLDISKLQETFGLRPCKPSKWS